MKNLFNVKNFENMSIIEQYKNTMEIRNLNDNIINEINKLVVPTKESNILDGLKYCIIKKDNGKLDTFIFSSIEELEGIKKKIVIDLFFNTLSDVSKVIQYLGNDILSLPKRYNIN